MDPNAPIKYSDLFQPDNSIVDLQNQLKELYNQYETLMKGIKAEAQNIKTALSTISGATTSGQETIKNLTSLTEKLAKKRIELAQSSTVEAKELAEVNKALREQNNLTKMQVKLNQAQEGSYDALSAQYSINKMKLNAMSAEERATSQEAIELEKETAKLYAEMKRLQEVTGKHTLSVGDYGIATANLASDIRNGIQALTQMRIEMKQLEKEGQRGSERWVELSTNSQKLAKDLKELKRQYQIVKLETNALGQQTGYLNDAIGVLSTGTGGLSALTGTMNLFGGSATGAAEALVQLNSVMAIANGVSQVYNGIFKSGNILLGIRTIQTKAATAAQNLQTKSTIAAKAAQIALNIVAKANPYVLLAAAVAALVVGLISWVSAGARAVKQQKLLNQQTAAALEYMQAYNEESTRIYKENQKALEQELTIAKARKASYAETQKLENQIQAEKERNNAASRGFYAQEIKDVEANRTELERLRKELLKAQSVKSNQRVEIQFDAEGPARKFKASKVIDILQDKINNLGKKVEIATELVYDQKQLEADAKALREQHRQQALEVAALERSALRNAEDVQISLLNNRFDKERTLQKANTARQITDLKVRLQTESNLTVKARKAINQQIENLQRQLVRNLEDIANEERRANIAAVRELEDVRLSARQETAEKQRTVLKLEYEREKQDLEDKLATDRTLTVTEVEALTQELAAIWAKYQKDKFDLENQLRLDQLDKEAQALDNQLGLVSANTTEAMNLRLQAIENQRQAELTANKALASDLRQDEAAINAKYDMMAKQEAINSQNEINAAKLESDQEYEMSVFNLKEHSENQIYKMQLKQQKERLKLELEAQKALLAVQTGEQRAMTQQAIKTLENQINAIDRELKKGKKVSNIWELFGFDSDAADALQQITDQILDGLREITQARIDAAEAAVEQAEKEVDASRKFLEYELEARANGYANQVETAQKELELNKKKEEEAIKEKKKAQEAQDRINTLTQISSLITATANIWSALGGIPIVGPALAIAGIAAMWGSFAFSKIKAAQIAKESYGEGTVELLQGGSHQSGHDVDLGTKPDGTRRRAEGGEFFAVINKRNSRRYRDVIPDVIKSFNDGTFASKYLGAYNQLGNFAMATAPATDVSRLERDVEAIKKQNETRVYVDKQGNTIISYKNLTRKLKS